MISEHLTKQFGTYNVRQTYLDIKNGDEPKLLYRVIKEHPGYSQIGLALVNACKLYKAKCLIQRKTMPPSDQVNFHSDHDYLNDIFHVKITELT